MITVVTSRIPAPIDIELPTRSITLIPSAPSTQLTEEEYNHHIVQNLINQGALYVQFVSTDE